MHAATETARIRGFDKGRWGLIQSTLIEEPWLTLPGYVSRISRDRPWRGLTVWHQVGPTEDLYVPPVSCHNILLRRSTSTQLLQRHGDLTRTTRWTPGESVIVPAGIPSFWRSTAPRDNIHLYLEPLWLRRAAGEDVRLMSSFGRNDPVLASLAHALVASLDNNVSLSAAFGENLALTIALHLLENYVERGRHSRDTPGLTRRQMDLLRETITAHLHERWHVADLAELVDLSPFHFSRAFKSAFGSTPHAYVSTRRLEAAARLIRETRKSLAEIAHDTGYLSAAHFAQAFRRHWGVAPSVYRQNR